VVLGWGSHVNSFAKLAQVTDAQNKACVKRSRVLFRGTPKIVYTFGCRTGSEARFGFRSAHLSGFFVKGEPWGTRSRKRSSSQVEMKNLSILVFGSRSFFGVTHATYEGHIGLGIYSKSSLPAVHY
jgi:hypothetical protein